MINQKTLKDFLHYDKETGIFTWLDRPKSYFQTTRGRSIFLSRFLGQVAGTSRFKGGSRTKYISMAILKKQYQAHNLAWLYVYGEFPKRQIDHIDGNGENNKVSNLRDVSAGENSRNRCLPLNNKYGIQGVKLKEGKIWYSWITYKGKEIYLGRYKCFFSACCARKSAERKYGFHENHGRT